MFLCILILKYLFVLNWPIVATGPPRPIQGVPVGMCMHAYVATNAID